MDQRDAVAGKISHPASLRADSSSWETELRVDRTRLLPCIMTVRVRGGVAASSICDAWRSKACRTGVRFTAHRWPWCSHHGDSAPCQLGAGFLRSRPTMSRPSVGGHENARCESPLSPECGPRPVSDRADGPPRAGPQTHRDSRPPWEGSGAGLTCPLQTRSDPELGFLADERRG